MIVCRIISDADWAAALNDGAVPVDPEGFVHLSTPDQVAATLDRYYAGVPDLLVLDIDTDRLPEDALRWEEGEPGEMFPHLYAPLPVAAVIGVR